jgi:NAD(P) transhydrogenase subunit alpha
MLVGVPRERFPGERRVAIVPASVPGLLKANLQVLVESGAGQSAGYPDAQYAERGADITPSRESIGKADVLLTVRAAGADAAADGAGPQALRPGQAVVGLADPLGEPQAVARWAGRGITLFALELLPRITRAQGMDVLSSMATVAGYRAVLLAAAALPRMFPLLMTAAGTLTPARVLVVGAGVAGLQAISTARRLGAVVSAYDVRPAVKEQVQSLGAKFIEMPLETGSTEGAGGYARQMDEDFYRRQRELMTRVVAESDVVIATAVVPGKKAPLLITGEMVAAMPPGSVVVDLAAERGGNCALTRPGQSVVEHGVTILGPTNLPAEVPYHASQMYSKNIATFLLHVVRDGQLLLDLSDPIVNETLVARDGQVVHPRVRELLAANGDATPAASGG